MLELSPRLLPLSRLACDRPLARDSRAKSVLLLPAIAINTSSMDRSADTVRTLLPLCALGETAAVALVGSGAAWALVHCTGVPSLAAAGAFVAED